MTSHHPRRASVALTLIAASLLAIASPASAAMILTPLQLDASMGEAQVGDILDLAVRPHPNAEGQPHAGREVILQYGHPRSEPKQGETYEEELPSDDAPVEADDSWVSGEITRIRLDDASTAAFRWTVPAEVDDHNVILSLVDENGDTLASAHVRVGNAEVMMFSLMDGKSGPSTDEEAAEYAAYSGPAPSDTTTDAPTDASADAAKADVPAPSVLALLGIGALLAIAARRRFA